MTALVVYECGSPICRSEGPLEDGELDRARAWGAQLAS